MIEKEREDLKDEEGGGRDRKKDTSKIMGNYVK